MISVNTENSEGQDEKFSFPIFYITLQLTKSILLHPKRILVFMLVKEQALVKMTLLVCETQWMHPYICLKQFQDCHS